MILEGAVVVGSLYLMKKVIDEFADSINETRTLPCGCTMTIYSDGSKVVHCKCKK